MPTVLRIGPYRFYFYANENQTGPGAEPPHIHVTDGNSEAIYTLSPVALRDNRGFSDRDARKIGLLVSTHAATLTDAWNRFFA